MYDWADQIANNGYPLPERHPIALSGAVFVRRFSGIGSTWLQEFSHPEAGPVSMYLTLTAADSVQKVSTNGAGSISSTGTYPNGTPYWCGPAYPSYPACYRYEGAPGNVTFERLNAEAELTADSSSAGHGSPVTFNLKSVPSHVEGQEMAVIIDKTSWTPDEDSLGGDPTDVAASGACTWSGPVSNKTCTRQIKSSGTFKVVGAVNGKYFEKTWHISRTDAYPILKASKYYVNAGQIDTFTVRMSDGSAFSMSNWSWFADSGVKQTVVGCGNFTNPCNNTAVKESGRMRARVVHNSVYKYSQVHVIVGPRPRLQLTANPGVILAGEQVLFTASAADAPVSITSWRFDSEGADRPVSCQAGNLQCLTPIPDGGVMTVYGTVDGVADTAWADVLLATEPCAGLMQQSNSSGDVNGNSVLRVLASSACTPAGGAPWSGGTRPDSLCGDVRDQIIAEYYDTTYFKPPPSLPGANWKPTCASFSQGASTQYFQASELKGKHPYPWDILQSSMLAPEDSGYGLDRWRQLIGQQRIVNSTYRPPKHNAEEGGVKGSRHMYGDAVDLRNETKSEPEFEMMRQRCLQANAGYCEPKTGPCRLNCNHADWRNHTNH